MPTRCPIFWASCRTSTARPAARARWKPTYNNFTTRAAGAIDQSGQQSAQTTAVAAAQSLAQTLNSTTQGIQTLRSNVEQDIGTSVNQANADMSQIATINSQLQGLSPTDPAAATLMDQRDSAINDLSKLMDIRVVTDSPTRPTSSRLPACNSSAAHWRPR